MNKNILFLIVSSISLCSVVATVIAVNSGTKNSDIFNVARGTEGGVWHHYEAVAPTSTTHGSKEFWANSNTNCLTYQLTKPGEVDDKDIVEHNNYSTYETFTNMSTDDGRFIPTLRQQNGIDPCYYQASNRITYGLYPQTNINNNELITALDDYASGHSVESNGWYLYNGSYYTSAVASYSQTYTFDNGTTITKDVKYWFKCEPISWDILSSSEGSYYLVSSKLLNAHNYDSDSNNYKNSDIRNFLTIEFYNGAFALDYSRIQHLEIDNSAATTNHNSNPYACDNTFDKVFLPSYRDYVNDSYGFDDSPSASDTRCCKTTDYARIKDAYIFSHNGADAYNGYYWTRSPSSGSILDAMRVGHSGDILTSAITNDDYCVRPAINFTFA